MRPVAGGMRSGRPGMSLAERLSGAGVRGGPAAPPPPTTPSSSLPPGPPPTIRTQTKDGTAAPTHCWVTGLPGSPGPCPGLLSEWSRDGKKGPWRGRVVYAVVDNDGRVVLVEAWVPADHLRPAAPG